MAKIEIQQKVQDAVKETYDENLGAQIHRAEILVAVGKKVGLETNPAVKSLEDILKTLDAKTLRGEKIRDFINKVDELNRVIIDHIRKNQPTNKTLKTDFSKYIDTEVQQYITEVQAFLDATPLKDTKGDVIKGIREQILDLKKAVENVGGAAVGVPGTAWGEMQKNALPQFGVENLDVTTFYGRGWLNIRSKLANSDWFGSTRENILKMMDSSVGKEGDASYLNYLIASGKKTTIATPFSVDAHEFITALKERFENGFLNPSLESKKWDAVIRRIDPKTGLDIDLIQRNLSVFTGAIDKIEDEIKRELDDPKKYIEFDFNGKKKRIPENGEFVSRMEKVLFLNTMLLLMKGAFQDVEFKNFAFWLEAGQAFVIPTTLVDFGVAINAILALIFNPFTANFIYRYGTILPRSAARESHEKFKKILRILTLEEIEKATVGQEEYPEEFKDLPENYKERLIILSKMYHYFDSIGLDDVKDPIKDKILTGGLDFFGTDARFYSKIVDILYQHLIAQDANVVKRTLAKWQLRARYYLLARYRYVLRAVGYTRIHVGVEGSHPSAQRMWTRLPENMKKMIKSVVEDMYTFVNDGIDQEKRNTLRERAKARLETHRTTSGTGTRPYNEAEKVTLRARIDDFIDNIESGERANKWWTTHVLESIVEGSSEADVRTLIDEGVMPDETRQNILKRAYELTSAAASTTEKLRFDIERDIEKIKTSSLHTSHGTVIDDIANLLQREFSNTPESGLENFKNQKLALVKSTLGNIAELTSHFQTHQARLLDLLKSSVTSGKGLEDMEKLSRTVDAIENRVGVKVDSSKTSIIDEIRGEVSKWLSLNKLGEIMASFPNIDDVAGFDEKVNNLIETASKRESLAKKVEKLSAGDVKTALEDEVKKMSYKTIAQVEKLVNEVTNTVEKIEDLGKIKIEGNDAKLQQLITSLNELLKKLNSKNIETSSFGNILKEVYVIVGEAAKLDKAFKFDVSSTIGANIPGRVLDLIQRIITTSQNPADFSAIKELVQALESLEESFGKKSGAPTEARESMIRKVDEIIRTQGVAGVEAIRKLNLEIDAQFGVEEQKAETRRKINSSSEITAIQKKELLDMLDSYKTTTTVQIDAIVQAFEQLEWLGKNITTEIEIAGSTESQDLKNKLQSDLQSLKVSEIKEFKERVEKIIETIENLKKIGNTMSSSVNHLIGEMTSRRARLSELQKMLDTAKQVLSISNTLATETQMPNEVKDSIYKKVESSVKSPNAQIELTEIINSELPKISKIIPLYNRLDVPTGLEADMASEARTFIDRLKASILQQIVDGIQTRGDDINLRIENILGQQDLQSILKKVFEIGSIHVGDVEIDATGIISKTLEEFIQSSNKEGVALVKNGVAELETMRSQLTTLEAELARWQDIVDAGGKVNKPIPKIDSIKERLAGAFSGGKVKWREVSEISRMISSSLGEIKSLKVTQEPKKVASPVSEKFDLSDGLESKAYKMLKGLELHFESIGDSAKSDIVTEIIGKLSSGETVEGISTEDMTKFKESLSRILDIKGELPALETVLKEIQELGGSKFYAKSLSIEEVSRINGLEEEARKVEIERLEKAGEIRKVLRRL